MKFIFKNFGIVKEASIEVNGLTVITGTNDTGKSFISKGIYSIIKTINNADTFMNIEKYSQSTNNLNNINSSHRSVIPFTQDKAQKFNTNILVQKLVNLYIGRVQSVNAELANEVREYIVKVKEDLESTKVNAPDSTKKRFEDAILNINIYEKKIIQTLEDIPTDEAKYKTYFDRNIIQRIFQSQINSLLTDNELSINIEEGVTSILKLVVEKNLTSSFKVDNPFYLKDATIIETPTIVQLAEFITNSLAFSPTGNQRGDLPLHYSDISQKVKISPPVSSDVFAEIFKMIKSVISGEMKFKSDEGGIVFIKNNGAIVRAFNIATGVKSLGLLQLLLNPTYVNQNSLLIIDEPEVHLHPQWEIEYAKIIVSLCASGIPVVISSHSPYLIQALSKFSKANTLVSNKTRFYFGDKSEGGFTTFIDVTNDKNPIYKKLAEPMRDLINN